MKQGWGGGLRRTDNLAVLYIGHGKTEQSLIFIALREPLHTFTSMVQGRHGHSKLTRDQPHL